jgi:hypothetical protein
VGFTFVFVDRVVELSRNGADIRLLVVPAPPHWRLSRPRDNANPGQVKTLMVPMTRTTSGKSLEPLAVGAVIESDRSASGVTQTQGVADAAA